MVITAPFPPSRSPREYNPCFRYAGICSGENQCRRAGTSSRTSGKPSFAAWVHTEIRGSNHPLTLFAMACTPLPRVTSSFRIWKLPTGGGETPETCFPWAKAKSFGADASFLEEKVYTASNRDLSHDPSSIGLSPPPLQYSGVGGGKRGVCGRHEGDSNFLLSHLRLACSVDVGWWDVHGPSQVRDLEDIGDKKTTRRPLAHHLRTTRACQGIARLSPVLLTKW